MQKIQTLSPIALVIAMAAGVLLHDTHIDKATALAMALPTAIATYGAAHLISSSDHTHVERGDFSSQARTFRSTMPKANPRDDDRRHGQSKRAPALGSGNGQASLWPSV